jgi:hypothetical protein
MVDERASQVRAGRENRADRRGQFRIDAELAAKRAASPANALSTTWNGAVDSRSDGECTETTRATARTRGSGTRSPRQTSRTRRSSYQNGPDDKRTDALECANRRD